MTAVLERPSTRLTDTTDNDGVAHYFSKRLLNDAIIFGTPIPALCGYVTIPYKNPDGLPRCPRCIEEWEKYPEPPAE